MKTYVPKIGVVEASQKWYIVDADGEIMGRLATKLATVLMGKHKPIYVPNVLTGDHIVVINVDKMRVTGKKAENKIYYHHTGFVGGIKGTTWEDAMEKDSRKVLQNAVRRMLPKNQIGRKALGWLKLSKGPNHEHEAQQPVCLSEVKF